MLISISGTPGTGKTGVARILARKLGANLIDIKRLIEKDRIPYFRDRKRNTRVVSTIDLKRAIEKIIVKNKTNIIEGHLSHFMKSDFIFILRCSPNELQKRLAKRGWAPEKIRENIQAEILDAITIEAIQGKKARRIYEVDTTKLTAEKTCALIIRMLKYSSLKRYHVLKKHAPGRIDWSEQYKRMLVKK